MKIRLLAICLACFAGVVMAQNWSNAQPTDPLATYETCNLLARLHWMRVQKMLFRHHESTRFHVNPAPTNEPRWLDVREVAGEWLGFWSFQINYAVKYGDPDGMRCW